MRSKERARGGRARGRKADCDKREGSSSREGIGKANNQGGNINNIKEGGEFKIFFIFVTTILDGYPMLTLIPCNGQHHSFPGYFWTDAYLLTQGLKTGMIVISETEIRAHSRTLYCTKGVWTFGIAIW